MKDGGLEEIRNLGSRKRRKQDYVFYFHSSCVTFIGLFYLTADLSPIIFLGQFTCLGPIFGALRQMFGEFLLEAPGNLFKVGSDVSLSPPLLVQIAAFCGWGELLDFPWGKICCGRRRPCCWLITCKSAH